MTDFEQQFNDLFQTEGAEIVARSATAREIARHFYLRGRLDSNEQALNRMSHQDAAKVEAATIGEHMNYQHLGDVLEARKQVS